jgi:hypothetical protein
MKVWRKWLLAAVPVGLIAGIFGITWWLREDPDAAGLRDGATYEIWLDEAEVVPAKASGEAWDGDGSAPDLRGVILWQDQRILDTVTANNGLIAQWQPVGVRFSQVLHGEADAASVRRVGRVRASAGGFIEVGVFDDDPARSDLAGAFRVPFAALRPGLNEIRDAGPLRSLRLVVVEPGGEGAKLPLHAVTGAEKLAAAPAAMDGVVGGMVDGMAREAAGHVDKLGHKAGQKAGEAVDAVRKWLQPEDK